MTFPDLIPRFCDYPKVKVWSQNRRIRWRKQSLEQQQAKVARMGLGTPERSPGSQSHHEEEEEEEEDKDFPAESGQGQEDNPCPLHRLGQRAAEPPRALGLDLSHCVGTNSLGPTGPWRSGGPCKMKRVRTVFKPEQLERLEQEFLKQQYMVGTERVDLAATLHLTETQVKVWFQNRRIKWRKQSMEQKAAKLSQFGVIQPASADSTDSKDHEEDTVDVEL
ncbi:hypothetical protein HGM15179_016154 [Zosterops borbonicus]|uniref:Homeobox domain-containing protein n=4 Tax=Sylvioidea TaxID=2116661 RepID=A0A8K1LEK2_9PASS|nr:hypothetical protein HGM15179_016154 [Zosterops borbonicus]